MDALELVKTLIRKHPYPDKAPMALAIAIQVACDHWTDADHEKYSLEFNNIISQWGKDMDGLPAVLVASGKPYFTSLH